jgi:hypothetical protein
MSSWSILLALSGYEYDGPARILRFAPRLNPEHFKAFFCGPEGWGSLQQTRDASGQRSTIAVVAGRIAVSQLVLAAQEPPKTARVTPGDAAALDATLQADGGQVRIILAKPQVVKAGDALSVVLA